MKPSDLTDAQKQALCKKYRAINFAVDRAEFSVHKSLADLGLLSYEGELRGAELDLWSKTPAGRKLAEELRGTGAAEEPPIPTTEKEQWRDGNTNND